MNSGTDKQRKALGKGLSALLPQSRPPQPPLQSSPDRKPTSLPLEVIEANPQQPRSVFEPGKLEELAASIKANGIIQPLIVRRSGPTFQIIAGERRWRAAKIAGLREVPVVVQDIADPAMLELALIENIQREDLNPIETAHAFERLARDLGLSQEELGRRTGKDRSTITNLIRLLKLPQQVQQLLAEHRISMGHARAILGLTSADDQILLAERAAARGLSVRQVEAEVKEMTTGRESVPGREDRRHTQDPNVAAAAEQLERVLGTRVRIVEQSGERGRIEIEYYSSEELDRVFQHIVGTE